MNITLIALSIVLLKIFDSTSKQVYADLISAKSLVRIDTLSSKGVKAPLKVFFYAPLSVINLTVSVMVGLFRRFRAVAPFGDSINLINPATINLILNDGSYPNSKGDTIMSNTSIISINNTDLPALQYNNKPVITLKMIDTVHQRPAGTARKRFNDNKKRFIEGKHFYLLDSKGLSVFRADYPGHASRSLLSPHPHQQA